MYTIYVKGASKTGTCSETRYNGWHGLPSPRRLAVVLRRINACPC